jgi:hypothetical protein
MIGAGDSILEVSAMHDRLNRRTALARCAGLAAAAAAWDVAASPGRAACCYFAARDKDINQPSQKAFLEWKPDEGREAFTVQPKFEGNAVDFGMVIPTPARPKLDEMPSDFFAALAVFTILEPMPIDKYKQFFALARGGEVGAPKASKNRAVEVLEEGVVGSLDYKIIIATDARGLYEWLDEQDYHYAGDEETLDFYIAKGWFFTVMKIDPQQMKRNDDGTYSGNVTPTRFSFKSPELIYPLRITRLSVNESTEALFYVQAPRKMDLPEPFSFRYTWQPMWAQAMSFAVEKTPEETAWEAYITPHLDLLARQLDRIRGDGLEPAALEWAKKITARELGVLDGSVEYNRDAPPEEVQKLTLLRGHIREDQFVTKFRKSFHVREMNDDLVLAEAKVGDELDTTDYYQILPTSPP